MEIKEQNTHTPPPSRALTQELRDTTQCRRGRRPGALLRHLPTVHRGTPGPEHPELGDDLVNGQLWSVFNLCSSEQGRRSSVLERGQSSCLASAIDLLGELFFFFAPPNPSGNPSFLSSQTRKRRHAPTYFRGLPEWSARVSVAGKGVCLLQRSSHL